MSVQNPNENLNHIIRQFLCCVPLADFKWNNIFKDLGANTTLQIALMKETVNSDLVLKFPIHTKYQKAFLKRIIHELEAHGLQESVIYDEVYSAYGRLVATGDSSEYYFKHYRVEASGKVLSLKESINLISKGTTGLRTWKASLALSEWAMQNKIFFKDKSLLELGSGIGLAGLVIAMECSPKSICLTDCHPTVLQKLCDNIELNIEKISKSCDSGRDCTSDRVVRTSNRCLYSNFGPPDISVLNLPWENVSKDECAILGTIEKVIAADVIYDELEFESLVKALKNLSAFCGVQEFIFSCTERNPKTLESFLKEIGDASFIIEELEIPRQENFIWSTETPVKLFRFHK